MIKSIRFDKSKWTPKQAKSYIVKYNHNSLKLNKYTKDYIEYNKNIVYRGKLYTKKMISGITYVYYNI